MGSHVRIGFRPSACSMSLKGFRSLQLEDGACRHFVGDQAIE